MAGKLRKLKGTGPSEEDAVLLAAGKALRPDAEWDEPTRFLISNKTEVVLERGTLWRYLQLPEVLDAPTALLANSWIARLPLRAPPELGMLPEPELSEEQLERLTITRLAERVAARLGAAQLHARGHREAATLAHSEPASRFAAVIQDLHMGPGAHGLRAMNPGEEVRAAQDGSRRAALCGLAEANLVQSRAALELAAQLFSDVAPTTWPEVATLAAANRDPEFSGVHDVPAALALSREARRRADCALSRSHTAPPPAEQRLTDMADGAQPVDQRDGPAPPTPAELIAQRIREARALLALVEVVLGPDDEEDVVGPRLWLAGRMAD